MQFPTWLVSKIRKPALVISILLAIANFLIACEGTNNTSTGSSAPTPIPTSALDTITPTTGAVPIDGVSCDTMGHDSGYHIHIRLIIYDNGSPVSIPNDLGHSTDANGNPCLYWFHTHDDSSDNIIHLEAPDNNFTPALSPILDIWQQTDASSFPTDLQSAQGWTIWLNGIQSSGGFDNVSLNEHDVVTMAYNSSGVTPNVPSDFDWTGY